MNQSRSLDAQLHPHWVNLGIIESLGHSKGIGGRTFQQNRSLVQAWGSWWLVIGGLYIDLGSAAKFGWLLQRLPSFSVQKRSAICGECDGRRIRWSTGISSVDHVEQFFKCQKLAAGCLATRARRWEAGGELYPVRFPVYWLLIMKPTKTTKHILELKHMLSCYVNCCTFPPKGRLPKFGLGFPFFVHIDFHLEQATPGTTLWSFWGTVATTAWGGVSFGRREKDKECLEVLLIWKLES